MKRIMLLVLLMSIVALTASAQNDPGTFSIYPRLGVNVSKFTDDVIPIAEEGFWGTDVMKPRYKQGWNAGAEMQYQFTDQLALSLGAMYAMQGTKFTDALYFNGNLQTEWIEQEMELHYINVPLLAVWYFGNTGISAKAGIQAGFLANARIGYTMIEYKKNAEGEWMPDRDNSNQYRGSGTDLLNKMNLSIPIGVSYEFNNVSLDLRYNLGLTKIYKDIDKVRNSSVEFLVGYKFDFE